MFFVQELVLKLQHVTLMLKSLQVDDLEFAYLETIVFLKNGKERCENKNCR